MQKKQQRQRGYERRRSVSALVLVVCGLLALLSILSYSREDESLLDRLSVTDVIRVFYNPEVKAQVALLHNRIGFVGALISKFFIVWDRSVKFNDITV